jgi:hypothetical protein
MTTRDELTHRGRTSAAMRDTAEQLEAAEDILHRSARRSPDPQTTARLHALGDDVTEQARQISGRADRIGETSDPARGGAPGRT